MQTQIPVIDLTRSANDPGADRKLARSIDRACREIGFLVVRGHGVEFDVVNKLRLQGKDFFAMPLSEKMTVRRPRNDQNRGYIPYGEETLARMHGGQTPPDFKEVFAVGPIDVPDTPYYTQDRAYPNFAPNLWPHRPPMLRAAMTAYFAQMERLMRELSCLFALALELEHDYFLSALDKHTSQLRLLHYPAPAHALEPGQLRCGEHTDLGMMTILHNQAAPGGLQIRTSQGEWIDAPALEDTFIVNLGDLMARWTNDRWRSTAHRVAVPNEGVREDSQRLSIGFFVGPNYDAVVECLPNCASAHNPSKYAPISVHDYRTARFAAGAGIQNRDADRPAPHPAAI